MQFSFRSSAAQNFLILSMAGSGETGQGGETLAVVVGVNRVRIGQYSATTSLPHLPHHSQADVMQLAIVVAPCNLSPTIMVAAIMAQYHLKVAGNPPHPREL